MCARCFGLAVICEVAYQEHSFSRLIVPMVELSFSRPFVPWNIRYSFSGTIFHGTFVPKDESALEHSFPGSFGTWKFLIFFYEKDLASVQNSQLCFTYKRQNHRPRFTISTQAVTYTASALIVPWHYLTYRISNGFLSSDSKPFSSRCRIGYISTSAEFSTSGTDIVSGQDSTADDVARTRHYGRRN